MSVNSNDILKGLNQIFDFLGPYGGRITIDEDWEFVCKVYLVDGTYEVNMWSYGGEEHWNLIDPSFRIEVTFDEDRKKIVSAKPIEYFSQWLGGDLLMNVYDNADKYEGDCESMEEDIKERLLSYIGTITIIRPYLTDPKTVERYEEYETS